MRTAAREWLHKDPLTQPRNVSTAYEVNALLNLLNNPFYSSNPLYLHQTPAQHNGYPTSLSNMPKHFRTQDARPQPRPNAAPPAQLPCLETLRRSRMSAMQVLLHRIKQRKRRRECCRFRACISRVSWSGDLACGVGRSGAQFRSYTYHYYGGDTRGGRKW
jgi:hypothetical protein